MNRRALPALSFVTRARERKHGKRLRTLRVLCTTTQLKPGEMETNSRQIINTVSALKNYINAGLIPLFGPSKSRAAQKRPTLRWCFSTVQRDYKKTDYVAGIATDFRGSRGTANRQ